ncbi:IS110 family transposase [Candidatus Dormiibacter inghamiae]
MERVEVTVGVDTHRDINVAVALDRQGRTLGSTAVSTGAGGHRGLLTWAMGFGDVVAVGIEGTGSYGAGLSRYVRAAGVRVLEVERPERRSRRIAGKTDTLDADRAARAVLAGQVRVEPKGANGRVESLRLLWTARRGAVKARTQAANQLHGLLITSPDPVRAQVSTLTSCQLAMRASRWRATRADDTSAAARLAIRSVARRYVELGAEIKVLDREMRRLVSEVAPDLVALQGVGYETATALLVAAGDNPDRLRSEASFAHLCGVAPLPASSGKTIRHRLSRSGDRQANRALFLIVLVRMYRDKDTKAYVARRTAQGLSKPEIIRCLKRYLAREVFRLLPARAS